jgi:hypothetical protein
VKKLIVAAAALVITMIAAYWMLASDDSTKEHKEAPAVQAAGVSPSVEPMTVGIVREEIRAAPQVAPALYTAPTPPGQEMKLGLGDTLPLKFTPPIERMKSGMGVGRMHAQAFRGQDKPIELEVKKVDKGVEVNFSPEQPGQFNVVLSEDGNPVAAQKVGVIGVVGQNLTDPEALFAADPVEPHQRVAARLHAR